MELMVSEHQAGLEASVILCDYRHVPPSAETNPDWPHTY